MISKKQTKNINSAFFKNDRDSKIYSGQKSRQFDNNIQL